jgi:hypothetical protein
MNKIEAPCHYCENRHLGCHSECEAYVNYCRENENQNALIRTKKAKEKEIAGYIASNIAKKRKINKKHIR